MVDYVVTSSAVQPTGSLNITRAIAGSAISAGQPLKISGGTVTLCQANSLANLGEVVGIALNSASIGQPVTYVGGGTIEMGAIFSVGDVVVVSAAAAGGIAPVADLVATNGVAILGVATSTSLLKLDFINSGVVK